MKRLSILMTFFCLVVEVSAGVIPDMKFKRLDTREGLSNSTVNSIIRDSRGYVWLGTGYGLNRYDGYRMRTFFSYSNDTTTLRNNRIDEIQEGHGGRLWLNLRPLHRHQKILHDAGTPEHARYPCFNTRFSA